MRAYEMSGINPWVIFVDDDQAVRHAYSALLGQAGYNVTTAANAREALNLIEESPLRPQLIITDQNMPIMTGLELATALHGSNIPLMLFSSCELEDSDLNLFRAVVRKPGNPQELMTRAAEVMIQ